MISLLLKTIVAQNIRPPVGIGEVCGGILDIECQTGLICEYFPHTMIGVIDHEQGKCVRADMSILPISIPATSVTVVQTTTSRSSTMSSSTLTRIATVSSPSASTPTTTSTSSGSRHGLEFWILALLL